jgi:predicted amidophosphoribosyltransferase
VGLIDDVHTTGATLTAAALELRRAGAGAVVAATLARAEHA